MSLVLQPTLTTDQAAALADLSSLADLSRWRTAVSGRRVPLDGLHSALSRDSRLRRSFMAALPRLGELTARLQAEHPAGLPLLMPGGSSLVELSRAAAAGLGAHLFFGSLPEPASLHPEQPFNRLDQALASTIPSTVAKLSAWLQWLADAVNSPPRGRLRLERRVASPPTALEWGRCERPLGPVTLVSDQGIEQARGCTQVDFANRFPGGGVLGRGNVQEELRFAMSPELLLSTLLCPAMGDDEAIVVHGAGHLARIEGYGGSARYAGPTEDPGPLGPDGTPQVEVLVLDAIPFLDGGDLVSQIQREHRLRELGKAWVGFAPSEIKGPVPVATGNWGCGVFGGHLPLKACLQWMAASRHGRALQYHSFGDLRLGDLEGFTQVALERGWTVGELWVRLDELEGLLDSHRWRPLGQGCGLPDGRSFYEGLLG